MRPTILLPLLLLGLGPASSMSEEDADLAREAEIDAMEPAVRNPGLEATAEMKSAPGRTVATGPVIDRMELDPTEITGNQELPKVLYIVPWKQSDLGDLIGRPVNSLLEEVLAPIDREVFLRQVGYHQDLYAEAETGEESP